MLDGDSSWSITASTRPTIARVYDKEDISCAASNFVIFIDSVQFPPPTQTLTLPGFPFRLLRVGLKPQRDIHKD